MKNRNKVPKEKMLEDKVPSKKISGEKIPKLPSPCEGICIMDGKSGLCKGCMRTSSEISEWSSMDNESRLRVVMNLRERRISAGRVGRLDNRPRRRKRVGTT